MRKSVVFIRIPHFYGDFYYIAQNDVEVLKARLSPVLCSRPFIPSRWGGIFLRFIRIFPQTVRRYSAPFRAA